MRANLGGAPVFYEHAGEKDRWAKDIQVSPSFCVVAIYCQPSLICEMWDYVKCWGDLLAAWSSNPSPGSLLGLGAAH